MRAQTAKNFKQTRSTVELDSSQFNLDEQKQKIKSLRSQLYYMLNENDNLKEQVSSLKSTLSTARETFQSSDWSEYLTTDTARKIAVLTQENNTLAQKLDSMTEQRDEAEKKVLLLKQLKEFYKYESKERDSAIEERLMEQDSQLQAKDSTIDQMKKSLASSRQDIEQLKQQINKKQGENKHVVTVDNYIISPQQGMLLLSMENKIDQKQKALVQQQKLVAHLEKESQDLKISLEISKRNEDYQQKLNELSKQQMDDLRRQIMRIERVSSADFKSPSIQLDQKKSKDLMDVQYQQKKQNNILVEIQKLLADQDTAKNNQMQSMLKNQEIIAAELQQKIENLNQNVTENRQQVIQNQAQERTAAWVQKYSSRADTPKESKSLRQDFQQPQPKFQVDQSGRIVEGGFEPESTERHHQVSSGRFDLQLHHDHGQTHALHRDIVPQLDLSSVLEKSRSRGGVLSQSTMQHGKTPSESILSPQQFSSIFKQKNQQQEVGRQQQSMEPAVAYGFGQQQQIEEDKSKQPLIPRSLESYLDQPLQQMINEQVSQVTKLSDQVPEPMIVNQNTFIGPTQLGSKKPGKQENIIKVNDQSQVQNEAIKIQDKQDSYKNQIQATQELQSQQLKEQALAQAKARQKQQQVAAQKVVTREEGNLFVPAEDSDTNSEQRQPQIVARKITSKSSSQRSSKRTSRRSSKRGPTMGSKMFGMPIVPKSPEKQKAQDDFEFELDAPTEAAADTQPGQIFVQEKKPAIVKEEIKQIVDSESDDGFGALERNKQTIKVQEQKVIGQPPKAQEIFVSPAKPKEQKEKIKPKTSQGILSINTQSNSDGFIEDGQKAGKVTETPQFNLTQQMHQTKSQQMMEKKHERVASGPTMPAISQSKQTLSGHPASEKTMKDHVISEYSAKSHLLQKMDENSEFTIEQEEIEVEGETDSDDSDSYDVTQQPLQDEIMNEDVEEYESEEDSEDDQPERLDTVPDRMRIEQQPGESEEDTVAREMQRLRQLAREGHSNQLPKIIVLRDEDGNDQEYAICLEGEEGEEEQMSQDLDYNQDIVLRNTMANISSEGGISRKEASNSVTKSYNSRQVRESPAQRSMKAIFDSDRNKNSNKDEVLQQYDEVELEDEYESDEDEQVAGKNPQSRQPSQKTNASRQQVAQSEKSRVSRNTTK